MQSEKCVLSGTKSEKYKVKSAARWGPSRSLFFIAAWWLSVVLMVTSCRSHGSFLLFSWWLFVVLMVGFCHSRDGFLPSSWWLSDGCKADSSLPCKRFLSSIKLLLSFVKGGFGTWDGRFPVFLMRTAVFHKAVFYFLLSLEKMFLQYR